MQMAQGHGNRSGIDGQGRVRESEEKGRGRRRSWGKGQGRTGVSREDVDKFKQTTMLLA